MLSMIAPAVQAKRLAVRPKLLVVCRCEPIARAVLALGGDALFVTSIADLREGFRHVATCVPCGLLVAVDMGAASEQCVA